MFFFFKFELYLLALTLTVRHKDEIIDLIWDTAEAASCVGTKLPVLNFSLGNAVWCKVRYVVSVLHYMQKIAQKVNAD